METDKSFFEEQEIDKNNSGLKWYKINFEFESGGSWSCASEGSTPEEAIRKAIIANPHGKNFILAPKPTIGPLYGMSTTKNKQ